MRIFPNFNQSTKCPICGTNEDKPATLIPIDGTVKNRLVEAMQVHVHCLQLQVVVMPDKSVIYSSFNKIKGDFV